MIIPGSCSNGLRSWPSSAAGSRRSKGLETASVNNKKPQLMMPITPITRARVASSSACDKRATAAVHPANVSAHSRIEPSWLPHTAVIR